MQTINWRRPTPKAGLTVKPSQPTMPFPTGLPPIKGFMWRAGANVNAGVTIVEPDFDPTADFAPYSIDGLTHAFVKHYARGRVEDRINAVAKEIGHRVAHSMFLRTGVVHIPDGYERAYKLFAYASLGYELPAPQKRPLNLRCLNTARMRRRDAEAERARIAAATRVEPSGQISAAF